VFLTGQREIEWFAKELREMFPLKKSKSAPAAKSLGKPPSPPNPANDTNILADVLSEDEDAVDEVDEDDDADAEWTPAASALPTVDHRPKEDLPDQDFSASESDGEVEDAKGPETASGPVHVVTLYSRQSARKQWECFVPPPEGSRMIVVATNVAETSLTIPNIRYVVDCGREKRRVYDQTTGTSTFHIDWTSQASANQRMGRAGRTSEGHCYRMYSTAVFTDQMTPKTNPELLTMPIEDLVLYMKSMGVKNVCDFPFPTAPSQSALATAIVRLQQLGALDGNEKATPLGLFMSRFPLSVRWSKMLVVACLDARFERLLPHVVYLAAHLSLFTPYLITTIVDDNDDEKATTDVGERRRKARQIDALWRGDGKSDALALLRAAGAYSHALQKNRQSDLCKDLQLDEKIMQEGANLRSQLATIVQRVLNKTVDGQQMLTPLSAEDDQVLLRQVIATGLLDSVAKRLDSTRARNVCLAEQWPFPPRRSSDWPYEACSGRIVRVHPNSFLSKNEIMPDWIVYSTTTSSGWAEGVTEIDPDWLCGLSQGGTQITSLAQLEVPEPSYLPERDMVICSVRPTFGPLGWTLPVERVPCADPYPWFARALLEGKVVPGWPKTKDLAAPAAHAARAPTHPRVALLVGALARAKVASKAALINAWRADANALITELEMWMTKEAKAEFGIEWPKVVKKIVMSKTV